MNRCAPPLSTQPPHFLYECIFIQFNLQPLPPSNIADQQQAFHSRPHALITMSATKISSFLSASTFAVVGASTRREKFGSKVLRCYLQNGKKAIPINPREEEIEGLPCLANLSALSHPGETAVSVITPPAVTIGVLEEAAKLGIKQVWLQPGCENAEVLATAEKVGLLPTLIYGGPCVLVELGFEGRH